MPKLDLSFSANFLQQTSDLKLSGNLDFSLFPQISAGKLNSIFSWKFRSYSFPADLIPKTADLIPKPPDFKLSGNLDLAILVFFSQISVGKLRSYAFWKFRSYSSTANCPRETSDLTLLGNLDLIPF